MIGLPSMTERDKFGVKELTNIGTNRGQGDRMEGKGMAARHCVYTSIRF